jgi:AraC family transcriptional regulator
VDASALCQYISMTVNISWADRVLLTLQHIQANLDVELSPELLANMAGFSPHHFHRIFKGMMGESVMEYVRRLRWERAAFLLKHGQGEVLSVALTAGYASHEAFTRAFKSHFSAARLSRWRSAGGPAPGEDENRSGARVHCV